MVKSMRAQWGSKLPFTIISVSGHVPHLYQNQRKDTTWRTIRNLSSVWKKREENELKAKIESLKNDNEKETDMDLDPNGTNFIMIDSTGASTSYGAYNTLVTEITRKLAADLPSIAIKTGKSKVLSALKDTDASGIEVALSNIEAGTPVLLLDLTKRPVMPPSQATEMEVATAVKHPVSKDAARYRRIEWYREQVENEERKRIQENLPDYDWDVCMIAHFRNGVFRKLERSTHSKPTHTRHSHTARATRVVLS